MVNIISKTKYAYIFSIILTMLSIAAISVWGLKFGIDFTGGTLLEIKFPEVVPDVREVEDVLRDLNLGSLTLQPTQNQGVLVRYASEDDTLNQKVFETLEGKYGGIEKLRVDFINSTVSQELKKNSLWAIFFAIAGIMAYIAWAFRKVSRPVESWRYGAGAVIALIHDVLITIGAFSILGHFYGVETGIPFVAALLTILGFSVHDTIVVYDRTRENLLRGSVKEKFPEVVNRSLNETLVRSINTSLTVIITLLAVYIFGGESIKYFSLALLIGVTFGTYSSIFIASALLVTSYNWKIKK
ncbi:MAG: protein-export membrane protein SecF [Candidatus Moranbacteria bacterium RIFOXYA12_FULL_44_15]|nr:MAG: protein-export membrane protein SecF [Candidatus Moranbacteria bacterium RIFOXYA12_FULL_44_15]OGI34945.1 MAG: protein-export membrane protein SecF [Candidatus Moranbacteria bacterium RIFOXYA2_FULL_43_15]